MHREVGRFVGDFVQKEINSQLLLHENKFSIEFVHCSGRACAHSFTIWLNFRTFSIFFGGGLIERSRLVKENELTPEKFGIVVI